MIYKRSKKDLQNQPQTVKKMAIGTYISIVSLNVNELNAPTKDRLAEWIQKQNPYICCLQETHFRPKDTYRLKVREWKNILHTNGKQKKAGVAVLISDKIDFNIKNITRDKEGHYMSSSLDPGRRHTNPRGRHTNCKYLCTQHRSTSIHKTNTDKREKLTGTQ